MNVTGLPCTRLGCSCLPVSRLRPLCTPTARVGDIGAAAPSSLVVLQSLMSMLAVLPLDLCNNVASAGSPLVP